MFTPCFLSLLNKRKGCFDFSISSAASITERTGKTLSVSATIKGPEELVESCKPSFVELVYDVGSINSTD